MPSTHTILITRTLYFQSSFCHSRFYIHFCWSNNTLPNDQDLVTWSGISTFKISIFYPPFWVDLPHETDGHLTKSISSTIQIQLNIDFALVTFLAIRSLQNFAHAMTAVLSWHVQNFVLINSPNYDEGKLKFPSNRKSCVKCPTGWDLITVDKPDRQLMQLDNRAGSQGDTLAQTTHCSDLLKSSWTVSMEIDLFSGINWGYKSVVPPVCRQWLLWFKVQCRTVNIPK